MKAVPDTEPLEVQKDLKNIPVKSVTKLNSQASNSYSYLLTTDRGENLKNHQKRSQKFSNLKIKWERYACGSVLNVSDSDPTNQIAKIAPHCMTCAGNHKPIDCFLVKTAISKPKRPHRKLPTMPSTATISTEATSPNQPTTKDERTDYHKKRLQKAV